MNRLADSLSPYLLQHARQPVHWWPWSPAALAEARASDRPILLSVGYSTCHWCHVMAHESFEDPAVAERMNRDFVCIKVDREERPDVDALYMDALQAMTGRGGWPMTLFLTPAGLPFYGGTYFPPCAGHGIAAFGDLLAGLATAWRERRPELEAAAERVRAALAAQESRDLGGPQPTSEGLRQAVARIVATEDRRNGGFGSAPKFPQAPLLGLLSAWGARTDRPAAAEARRALAAALEAMASGGLMDQVGGGFHRYCVDADWTVPHFEKMLYDNALLLPLFLAAERQEAAPRARRAAEGIVAWLRREMRHPGGAFFAAQDADQAGEEGRSYLWRPAEIAAVLGAAEGAWAAERLGVTAAGNAEGGRSVPTLRGDPPAGAQARRLDEALARLLAARAARPAPATDDKLLLGWNGLCVLALHRAGLEWGRPDLQREAETALRFLLAELRLPGGGPAHVWRAGRAEVPAFLYDLAALALACLSVAQGDPTSAWARAGLELCAQIEAEHVDEKGAVAYRTGPRHETLFLRGRDLLDQALPSGAALAAAALLERQRLLGRSEPDPALLATISLVGGIALEHPGAVPGLLTVAVQVLEARAAD